jgi:hypothetical protein
LFVYQENASVGAFGETDKGQVRVDFYLHAGHGRIVHRFAYMMVINGMLTHVVDYYHIIAIYVNTVSTRYAYLSKYILFSNVVQFAV